MIIDLTEEKLLGASEGANIRDLLSQGDIPIKLNTIVAGKISGSYRRNFVNWDGSELTDGTITGLLSSNLWNRSGCLLLKYCSPSNGISIDESALTDVSLGRLIEASDFNGRDPYDVSFIVNGIEGPIPASELVICDDNKFLAKSDDGIKIQGIDPLTLKTGTFNAMIESYATKEEIELTPPMKRYRFRSKWSDAYCEFVYSNTSGCYIQSTSSKVVITGLESDGTIHTDFMDYFTLPKLYSIFHRRVHDYDNTLIIKDVAEDWVGMDFNGMTPVIHNGHFSFDYDQREITYRLGYHDTERVDAEPFTSGFTIGFEVEKEDEDALRSVCANDLYDDTNWAKERDGSLDDDSGFELVSPTYDLMSDKLDNDIKLSAELMYLIDARYSRACGGHIHLGCSQYSGRTFFDKLSPWVPLIYSLYVGRIGRDYCKVKKNEDMKDDRDKYQAIRIFDNRVEFRIISAVKDVDTLIWRRDLMRIIVQNLEYTPMKIVGELLDQKSKLYAHLRKQYTPSQLTVKAKLYAYFASELLDDAYAVKQHVMNAVDHFSQSQIRHLKLYSFNVNTSK
jgi:hypothetical protein